ncbi:MAG: helix-turn-helix domain-containing protein [Rhodospirillaceae bacterium]|nr:helix-turn-helix domain-containing protein [Rhodospirillaceae bacterium]
MAIVCIRLKLGDRPLAKVISKDSSKKLRKQGGRYLQKLRNAAGLTQREVAEVAGFKYYTFISQIENGAGRIPPALYADYAKVVDADLAVFVKDMLKFYDPYTHHCLYGPVAKKKAAKR